MHINLKHAMLTGASIAFLAFSGASFTSTSAQAGPLAVTPKNAVAPGSLTDTVQYRRARGARVGVRRAGVRTVRRGYYGGGRYVYRRGYSNAFFPAAVLGLFAGALGAATYGAPYYSDPAYYSWNYGAGYYPSYYPSYYGGYYGGGYYPAYWGGYYPAYRPRVVRYRTVQRPRAVRYRNVQRPRAVRYRAVAPRRHVVGSRTFVRSGSVVRRGGRR